MNKSYVLKVADRQEINIEDTVDDQENIGNPILDLVNETKKIAREWTQFKEKFIMDSLRNLGYRPKNNKLYFTGLKHRLKKQGKNIELKDVIFKETSRHGHLYCFELYITKEDKVLHRFVSQVFTI